MIAIMGIVPNFLRKEPIPPITNPDLLAAIEEIRNIPSVMDAMQRALDILSQRFTSKRFSTWLLFWKAFGTDPNELWKVRGFLHCHQQNYLFRILMVESGKVKDEDIGFGHSYVWYISPHQFLKVHLPGQWVAIDTWNYHFGAKIGQYATGFGMKTLA